MTYLHEHFQMLKPLSDCDMLRGKQDRNVFLSTHTTLFLLTGHSLTCCPLVSAIACRIQRRHSERNLDVIISHSSNANSTSLRLQFLSLSKMTDCQTYSPSASSLQSHIIWYLNQTYISIKTRQNSILRLAQERCVPFYFHERGREKVPLFCSLPSLTGSV